MRGSEKAHADQDPCCGRRRQPERKDAAEDARLCCRLRSPERERSRGHAVGDAGSKERRESFPAQQPFRPSITQPFSLFLSIYLLKHLSCFMEHTIACLNSAHTCTRSPPILRVPSLAPSALRCGLRLILCDRKTSTETHTQSCACFYSWCRC